MVKTTSAEIKFQYYKANIKDSTPIGFVTLDQFFQAIKDPKPEIKEVFNQIKLAELSGDMELKAKLKTSLYSFTPAVIVSDKRCYSSITQFTGLMPLDFDHLTQSEAQELKEHLFNDYPFIIGSWLSASKCGVRALVNIPQCESVDEYKQYFDGIQHLSDLGKYKNFDIAPKNAVLPLFLSYDPDIYYGDCLIKWEQKYKPVIPPKKVQYKYDSNPSRVYRVIESAIDKITNNGHPQLRAASFALGGYIGAGYIAFDDALDIIFNLIESNQYLSQKPKVYKKTAETMIKKGIQNPLYL